MNLSRLWLVVAAVVTGTLLAVDAYVEQMKPRPVLAASAPFEPASMGSRGDLCVPEAHRPHAKTNNPTQTKGLSTGSDEGSSAAVGGAKVKRSTTTGLLPYPGLDLLGVGRVCDPSDQGYPSGADIPAGSGIMR